MTQQPDLLAEIDPPASVPVMKPCADENGALYANNSMFVAQCARCGSRAEVPFDFDDDDDIGSPLPEPECEVCREAMQNMRRSK
jgi:hypothetical protein